VADRARVTWELRNHRGRKLGPECANRPRLLRARERLSQSSFARMRNTVIDEDPSAQILSAWIAKDELRTLSPPCAPAATPTSSVHRLHRFLTWCIDSQIPELLTLAATIDTWWPDINAYIRTGIPNAAPRATTASSNRSNASDADSATEKTPPAGYDSPAPANSGQQPRLQARPVKIEADI